MKVMVRDCDNCVYSTRSGNCRKWSCEGAKTVEDIKAEGRADERAKVIDEILKSIEIGIEATGHSDDYTIGFSNALVWLQSCITHEEPQYFSRDTTDERAKFLEEIKWLVIKSHCDDLHCHGCDNKPRSPKNSLCVLSGLEAHFDKAIEQLKTTE